MLITTTRTYPHAVAWSWPALRNIEAVLITDCAASNSDGASNQYRVVVYRRGCDPTTLACVEDIKSDRNDKGRAIEGLSLVRRTAEGSTAVVAMGGKDVVGTVCVVTGGDEQTEASIRSALETELGNCRVFYSRMHEWADRIRGSAAMRAAVLMAFVITLVLGFRDCSARFKADQLLSKPEMRQAVLELDPSTLPVDQANRLRAVQEDLRSEGLKSSGWKHAVPVSTIIWWLWQGVVVAGLLVVGVLYRRWFPRVQFRIGEGEERYQEKRRFQVWVCGFLITGVAVPLVRTIAALI